MRHMNIIALLPMKGHSERVPNKNIRIFNERPLFHNIAKVLESSDYIKKIIINTDDKFIAENAKENFSKVLIIDRPSNLQGDLIPMNEIINYDISKFDHEHFLQTHSTNPLLTKSTLERAIEFYFSNIDKYDSLFSVTKEYGRFYWDSGEPINHNPEKLLRTQDLTPLFKENSNIYIFSKSSFYKANNNRIGTKPFMFEMNKFEAIDIDNEEDFILAEILMRENKICNAN